MENSYNETYHQSFESTNWKNDNFNDDKNLINQYLELHRRDLNPEDIKEIASELDRQKSAEYLNLLSEKNDITLDDRLQIKTLKKALNIPNNYNSEDLNEDIEVYLDFNFEEARCKIHQFWGSKEYVLNKRYTPIIRKVTWKDNYYTVTFIMRRNSRSSMRWDRTVELNFYYNGRRLIFFNDRNGNSEFDKREWGNLTKIKNNKWVFIENYRWWKFIHKWWKDKFIKLREKDITTRNIKNMTLKLDF